MTGDFDRLLAGAREGDESAWGELYRSLAPAVLGYLRANRAPDPEDVCSETMLQLARDIGRFEGDEAGLRSFALTVAHHRLLDARRYARRRPVDPVAELPEPPPAAGGDAETAALERIEGREALTMLEVLSEDQRTVITLRLLGDMSVAEVAKAMGRRQGAVKQLQRRGLAALERELERRREKGP